jgi:cyclopropane-fatty-acyl-phospholipid synthase
MSADWVQFYAREFVLRALSQISQGRLTVVSKYEGGDAAPVVLGQQSSKDSEDDGRGVSVVINNPNAWTRICQAFDLVCVSSHPDRLAD